MNYRCLLFPSCFITLPITVFANDDIDERVVVTASSPDYANHLKDTLPVSSLDLAPLSQFGSAAEALTQAPEVTFNGQGGLLQTISIRGLSRWRIQTLVEGIPIHSERRAGNAAEFIAPGLLGRSYLLPGAASTQLGSGALGGGIDLRLATRFDTQLSTSFSSAQDYRDVSALGGQEYTNHTINWGLSYRHGNNSENANNQELVDGFEQSVGWAKYSSDSSFIKEGLFLYSTANNIGKASSDLLTERITEYPRNDHWLGKLELNWLNATIYAHSFTLDTNVSRPGRRFNALANGALGWGASIGEQFSAKDWLVNWKLALDARSDVEALEREFSDDGTLVIDRTNLAAEQQAYSLSFDATRQWDEFQLSNGVRLEHLVQQDTSTNNEQTTDDTNLSAFVAARYYWNDEWSTALYTSSAFRVPVLTERFFNGNTPRGITLGDPNLQTEQGFNLQFNIDYQLNAFSLGLSASRQWINNYIERINLSDELQQYVNLGDAQIDAVSYVVNWSLNQTFDFRVSGQWLWGEDNNGAAINDISPHQHDLSLNYQAQRFHTWFNLSYRQRFDRPGTSELALPSSVFASVGATLFINDALNVSAQIKNLSDKVYAVSSDDLSPLSRGRDIQLNIDYSF